jgi:hypothetical protein
MMLAHIGERGPSCVRFFITVTKFLRETTKEEGFILADGFRDFSSW